MKKTMIALLAVSTMAVATVAVPSDAFAQRRGGAVAAGVIGGLAAGAILGGALAAPHYYGPGPVYVAPRPVRCYWARGEPHWDGYAWVRPRVQVCD